MNKFIVISIVALMTVGCASSNGYKQAKGNGYGYTDTALTENRYRINYKAKSHQSAKAKNYALLRAAELTLDQGYDWFVVVDRETRVEKTEDRFSTSMQTGQTVTKSCGLLSCTTQVHPSTQYGVGMSSGNGADEAIASLEIRMGKGVKPASGDVYDAMEIKDSLGKRK
ncbi:CC0125/CC1285 family lipoprotein [Simiduia agarivorans]|uniref:Lipoprotein n=1 Tax=Simiduia agarivorans (strain DSM 21679 / JCM 13881 / BCRC 17597 / SA1) TaxID=1117647 RepID=K4KMS9_SIMAS|nr:hypothetical protein [Simiduia agarivorans]AFV00480.1 hypothetical protein M5M_16745 [Simiduia agarivorans SA1 = DSM 21679]